MMSLMTAPCQLTFASEQDVMEAIWRPALMRSKMRSRRSQPLSGLSRRSPGLDNTH